MATIFLHYTDRVDILRRTNEPNSRSLLNEPTNWKLSRRTNAILNERTLIYLLHWTNTTIYSPNERYHTFNFSRRTKTNEHNFIYTFNFQASMTITVNRLSSQERPWPIIKLLYNTLRLWWNRFEFDFLIFLILFLLQQSIRRTRDEKFCFNLFGLF